MKTKMARSARYRRQKHPKPFRITTRDEEILKLVYDYRILRSTHIDAFIGGSRQHLRRRLQLLFQHKYLDRIRDPRPVPMYAGSKPMLYVLGREGERHLAYYHNAPRPKSFRTDKFSRIKGGATEHTLLVSDFMASVSRSCRQSGNVQLIHQKEIEGCIQKDVAAEQKKRNRSLFEWRINVKFKGKKRSLGVRPDMMFGLRYRNAFIGRPKKSWFFLEVDRGTEIVTASGDLARRQSATRKFLTYRQSWKEGVYKARFGIPDIRTIFLISTDYTGEKRTRNFIDENKRLSGGRGSSLFLFIDHETFRNQDNILNMPFTNGRGEKVSLASAN